MQILLPALVALVGLIIFAVTDNPKLAAIGDNMFWTGLLVTLFHLVSVTFSVGH